MRMKPKCGNIKCVVSFVCVCIKSSECKEFETISIFQKITIDHNASPEGSQHRF